MLTSLTASNQNEQAIEGPKMSFAFEKGNSVRPQFSHLIKEEDEDRDKSGFFQICKLIQFE